MVENGFGIAFLHKSLTAGQDKILSIPLKPRFRYPIVVARHKSFTLTEPMQHLILVMKEYCQNL